MSDLTTPLGLKSPDGARKRRPVGVVASVAVVGLAAAFGVYLVAVDDPLGGEPVATAKIDDVRGSVGRDEVTVVGVKSGAGQILPAPGSAPVASAESAPEIAGAQPTVAVTALPTAALAALVEDGPFGPIPKVGDDGTRPLDAYARPTSQTVGTVPRVAVVVGGIGLSETGTQEALRQLPGEVTLALAPYGTALERWTTEARRDGHELLLQVPLEPFDYPDNDPGPHTLTVSASPEKNRENLAWVLARSGPYVGLVGATGGRFTAEAGAMDPLMTELGRRGLMYLDDGTSSRSRAAEIAGARKVPFAGADLVIDAVASEADIAGRLAQLEQIARTRGLAVGMASALPVSVRTIGSWAKGLEQRGIALVPVSATLKQP